MERRSKERLIGASVLVMLAVIFIPMILDDTADSDIVITETNIPARKEEGFSSRITPLDEPKTIIEKEKPAANIQPVLDDEKILMLNDNENSGLTAAKTQETAGIVETAPPAPETETVPAPETDDSKGLTAWVVQLGSFTSGGNANSLNEKLRAAGFPSFVEPIKTGTSTVYRVRVGPELLRSDAQVLKQKLDKLLKNDGIQGILLRYP